MRAGHSKPPQVHEAKKALDREKRSKAKQRYLGTREFYSEDWWLLGALDDLERKDRLTLPGKLIRDRIAKALDKAGWCGEPLVLEARAYLERATGQRIPTEVKPSKHQRPQAAQRTAQERG